MAVPQVAGCVCLAEVLLWLCYWVVLGCATHIQQQQQPLFQVTGGMHSCPVFAWAHKCTGTTASQQLHIQLCSSHLYAVADI